MNNSGKPWTWGDPHSILWHIPFFGTCIGTATIYNVWYLYSLQILRQHVQEWHNICTNQDIAYEESLKENQAKDHVQDIMRQKKRFDAMGCIFNNNMIYFQMKQNYR